MTPAATSGCTACSPRTERAALAGLLVMVGLVLGFTLHAQLGLGGHALDDLFRRWVGDLVVVGCAGLVLVRALTVRAERTAWALITLGMASWALGSVVDSLFLRDLDLLRPHSPAGVFGLGMYPFTYVGIALLLRSRLSSWKHSMWLDGLIGAAAVAALSSDVVLGAVLNSRAHAGAADLAPNLLYPIGDLVLLMMVVGALALDGWSVDRTWMLLVAGFATCTVTDAVHLVRQADGAYVVGTVLDAGWLLAALLVACAAWQPARRARRATSEAWRSVVVPSAFALMSLGVLLAHDNDRARPVTVVLASTALVGVLVRMWLTFREYTAMVRTSRGTTESFRALVATIPGAIYRCSLNPAWDMEYLSDHIERIAGYPASDFLGLNARSFSSIVHPDDRGSFDQVALECVERRLPYTLEYRIVRSDGAITWVQEHGQAVFGEEGEVRYLGGVIIDVTEQRRLTEMLAESEARYANLVENLSSVVYLSRHDRRWHVPACTYVSSQIERLLGVTVDAWVSDPDLWMRMIHPDDIGRVRDEFRLASLEERSLSTEYRFLRQDGTVVWVAHQAAPMRDAGGTVAYIQGSLEDITDRKLAEVARDRAETDLRLVQKLEAVGQLAAGIAHEINTPVQFVGDSARFLEDAFNDLLGLIDEYRSLTGSLRDALEPGAQARLAYAEAAADVEYLIERVPAAFARTFDGIQRVATIVRAMKEFAHPATLEHAPADINRALESTLVVARSEIKYVADVDLDLGDLPPVMCLVSDLNQVFLNLVVNAAQAIADVTPDGERGRLAVRTRCEGDEVVIEIEDTGGGIPEEHQSRVFEPFFTTREVGQGSGQGLALARSVVVDRHHGTLTFETEPGVGTTFVIRLPIDQGDCSERRAA